MSLLQFYRSRGYGAAPVASLAAAAILTLLIGRAAFTSAAALPPTDLEPAIRAEDVRAQVRYLASEALEGRGSGTPGGQKAAEFIAAQFRAAGLKPAGSDGSYFQPFRFTAGVRLGEKNALTLHPQARGERRGG